MVKLEYLLLNNIIMRKIIITEEEKNRIINMHKSLKSGRYINEQVTTTTTTRYPTVTTTTTFNYAVTTTTTVSKKNTNRPPCIGNELNSLGCWLDEIDRVQREIGNPKTWTMDSYNRLQKTLNDYKTWRTTTPEGQAVQDRKNVEGEYVVQLPDHLKNT